VEPTTAGAWLFALGLWCLLFTLNALRPFYRPGWAALLSFLAGWPTAELPWHHLAWQAALATWLGLAGGLGTRAGSVGLCLFVLAWMGLGVCAWEAQVARRALGRARPGQPRPSRLGLALPWPVRPREVRRLGDLVYREAAGRRGRLDLFLDPRAGPGPRPLLLQIHGGGWVLGDKRQQGLPLMHLLARRGWLCAAAGYRLAPGVRLPEQVEDLQHAIAWLRARAPEHGGDPSFLVLTGGSAGGHLCSLLALLGADPGAERPAALAGADLSAQGCLPFYGIYDLWDAGWQYPNGGLRTLMERHVIGRPAVEAEALYKALSPIYRVTQAAPPFLLIHGTRDSMAPLAVARRFREQLGKVSRAPAELLEVEGAQHAFEVFPSVRCLAAIEAAADWADALWAAHKSARAGSPR
jgi:acetyl esterase/lipase